MTENTKYTKLVTKRLHAGKTAEPLQQYIQFSGLNQNAILNLNLKGLLN